MLNFRKKYLKIFSEVIKGMKLKVCINVYVIRPAFFFIDLWEFFFRFWVGGAKKKLK